MRTLFRTYTHLLVNMSFAAASVVVTGLYPIVALADRLLTVCCDIFDRCFPMNALVADGAVICRTSRDVTYLTTGLHRLARPVLMRQGDPGDEDDNDDTENAMACCRPRMNC